MKVPFLFAVCTLIWGTTYFAITYELGPVPPEVSVFYRFFIAFCLLLLLCLMRKERLLFPWKDQAFFALQGLFTFSISYILTYNTERYLVSGLVSLVFCLMIFFNALGARIFFHTPVTKRLWLAGFMGLLGVFLLFWHDVRNTLSELFHASDFSSLSPLSQALPSSFEPHKERRTLLGLGMGVLSAFSSSTGNLVATRNSNQKISIFSSTMWATGWGTLFVFLYLKWQKLPFLFDHRPSYLFSLLYLSFFGSVVAFLSYFTLLKHVGPSRAAYIGVVTPVLAVVLSVLFEGFVPELTTYIGMGICALSLALAVRKA